MFLILEGTGELRLGDRRYPLRAMDVVACPTGGPGVAHQIVNTGSTDLRYLAVSNNAETEVCEYPDAGKIGIFSSEPGVPRRFDPCLGSAMVGVPGRQPETAAAMSAWVPLAAAPAGLMRISETRAVRWPFACLLAGTMNSARSALANPSIRGRPRFFSGT